MERTKWPAITGLVIGTILLSLNTRTTFAFDKPIHTAIVLLLSGAGCIIGLSRWLPRDGARVAKGQQYEAIPLYDAHENGDLVGEPREHTVSGQDVEYPSSLRKLRILFLALVFLITIRIEIFRQVLANVQCARATSWTPLIPLLFAAWDYWRVQRHARHGKHEEPDGTLYDALESYIIRAPYRYLAAVGIVSVASIVAIAAASAPYSIHICASSMPYRWAVPLLQHVGTLFDVVAIYLVHQLLSQEHGRGERSIALRFRSIAYALLVPALAWSFVGIVYYYQADRIDRRWTLGISGTYFWSVLYMDAVVCFTFISALFTLYHNGILTTTVITIFVSISTLTSSYVWSNAHPFPTAHSGLGFLAISLATLGFATYFHIETISERPTHNTSDGRPGSSSSSTGGSSMLSKPTIFDRVPSWLYLVLLCFFFVRSGLWASHSTTVTYHPIDMLIYDAQTAHEAYVNQTSASKTVQQAVVEYKRRYGRTPPPKFDEWYKYATARNSVVIDDYDSIHRDLLPFHSLTPQEIRERTFQLIANPWNDAAGISIRAGRVSIGEGVVPTHRWMLDGLVDMISKFAEHLPDLDLAFNLNDECRIAVPYDDIEMMRQRGAAIAASFAKVDNVFSDGRTEQWKPIPDPPITETPLTERSWQRTFLEFGAAGCAPGSPARSQRRWDISSLCTSCTWPQSLGTFLANWTLAAEVCHQPDLADLHGIYLAPAAFKATHELYPIFSQSKVGGFNDILYPSAWNYIDKALYNPTAEHPDPPFAEKNASLFWRGATSEGFSTGRGQWKGMTRQRFIHVANNINGSNSDQSLLLPYPISRQRGRLVYTNVPVSELTELLSVNVKVVSDIARCGGRDCPDQAAEFAPLAEKSEFQAHWGYKYLLDLDGAGFSGRFLPFMHSRSLPFKAAVFREWWDDRLTPWHHFVPLDVRGHGFWATVAYFARMKPLPLGGQGQNEADLNDNPVALTKIKGQSVKMEAHERQAERIAEDGRLWAQRVLRKEDMEIYFFRLLLEWGRLTDDRRDEIGYSEGVG